MFRPTFVKSEDPRVQKIINDYMEPMIAVTTDEEGKHYAKNLLKYGRIILVERYGSIEAFGRHQAQELLELVNSGSESYLFTACLKKNIFQNFISFAKDKMSEEMGEDISKFQTGWNSVAGTTHFSL